MDFLLNMLVFILLALPLSVGARFAGALCGDRSRKENQNDSLLLGGRAGPAAAHARR
jgi:hypothetical protein